MYEKGVNVGIWKSFGEDSILISGMNYVDDNLNVKHIVYDSIGNISYEETYKMGVLLETTQEKSIEEIVEVIPRFPGCEDLDLSDEEKNECAQRKMLMYIYGSFKYPASTKEYGVEGMAKFQFVVDKDGVIKDIETLLGISGDIKKECLGLIEAMPQWRPGYQDGKPVKVQYTLPVRFKLE